MTAAATLERAERVRRLFDELASLDPASRSDRLEQVDDELRSELEHLLAIAADGEAMFESFLPVLPESKIAAGDRLVGQTIGHFRIDTCLGRGGMGVVYRAQDLKLGRTVALKFLPPERTRDDAARQRFIHEARAASSLDHPNICTIHDVDETADGQTFIVMACYEGRTLKDRLVGGPLPVDQAIRYAAGIAAGLVAAHAGNIVHRDVKPANIMITDRDEVKLLDFGLAKLADIGLTRTGSTPGTAAYMSPEQAGGNTVDHRTDLWSLGVVLYEMVTGVRPFRGEYAEALVYAILCVDPPAPSTLCPEVSPALDRIILRCLAKDAAHRYGSAAELKADLDNAHVHAYPVETPAPVGRPGKRLWSGVVVLSVAVVLLAGYLAGRGWPGRPEIPNEKHVAVLPVRVLSAGAADRLFCEGLMELVTSQLARTEPFAREKTPSFWVIPASEVIRNEVTTIDDARRVLGANLAITASYREDSSTIYLTLGLVDTGTRRQVDSRVLTTDRTNRLALQNEIASQVLALLRTSVVPEGQRVLAMGGTYDERAFDLCMRGIGHLLRPDREERVDSAGVLFGQAIARDPGYARAYAGRCEAYLRKRFFTKDVTWARGAYANCTQALELDKNLVPAIVNQALSHLDMGDPGAALNVIHRAVVLDDRNSDAYRIQGHALLRMGRIEEAESSYRRAVDLRPDYWLPYNTLGLFYYNHSRYEEAIQAFKRAILLTPDNVMALNNLGASYFALERIADARKTWERVLAIRDHYAALSNLGSIYFDEGRFAEAARMYEKALDMDARNYVVWGNLACAYFWAPEQRIHADTTFRRALAMADDELNGDPDDPPILADAALYAAMIGQSVRARRLADRVVQFPSLDDQSMINAAEVYAWLGQEELAVQWTRRALAAGYSRSAFKTNPWLAGVRNKLENHND